MSSAYLTPSQLGALIRIGDLLLPGDESLPSFSAIGCIQFVDEILAETPEKDVNDLVMLLRLLSILPTFASRWLVTLGERADKFPAPIAVHLRLLNLGLRGIIYSLFYSGKSGQGLEYRPVLECLGYELICQPD